MRVATLTAVECAPSAAASARTATAALAAVVSSGSDVAAHRGSKLTRLLHGPGIFGGNCATLVFACCHPSKDHKDATLDACKFATDAAQLPNATRANDFGSPDELAEHAACLRADEAAMRQHSRNLEDILAQLGVQAGGLSSGKSFFSSKKKDKRANREVAKFDPLQVLRMNSECDRLMRSRQQALADVANLEAEVVLAKSVNAGLMMDISEVREAKARNREEALPLIEKLRELRAETAADGEVASSAVAQHGSMELLQLEAKAEELRKHAKVTRAAITAARRREQMLGPRLVPNTEKLYRTVARGAQAPSAAAVAAAQQNAAAQQSRAVASSSKAISASVDSSSLGQDKTGFTFELLVATFGCAQQLSALAPAPPVAAAESDSLELSGMTQTDGTVLDEIDVRDVGFIRSEIDASREDLQAVQRSMELPPRWRAFLADPILNYTTTSQLVADGVPTHVRGAYWIKILEGCGCPSPCDLDGYITLASAEGSKEAAAGWRDDSPLATVDRMFGSDRLADRQNRALHRVLRAYAQVDPALKYCEAIGLVAGICLKVLPEYEAFRLLAALLLGEGKGIEPYLGAPGSAVRRAGLGLRGLYTEGFPLLECLQRQLNSLLRRYAGNVAYAYDSKAFSLKQLCAPWLFTLFTSSFPSKVGVRIWDHVILQLVPQFGSADRTTPSCAILSIACVALVKQHRDELMGWNVSSAKEFHNEIGMLLAESAISEAYFRDHFMPLTSNKQTIEQVSDTKATFDREWAASHQHLPEPSTVVPPQHMAGGDEAQQEEEELRIDPADGEAYTREDFVEQYGGTDEWDMAERVVPTPPQVAGRGSIPGSASSRPLGNIRTVAIDRVVRAGYERDSKKVGKLKVGERIEVLESRQEDDGGGGGSSGNKRRVRFDQGPGGLRGWVSSTSSGEGLAFEEEIVAALEHNLEVWLATVPIGGDGNRSYDMRDLVRFAKTWKLEKAAPEDIYAQYVDHYVEDSQGWVAAPLEGETAFDISKYQKKGLMDRMKSRRSKSSRDADGEGTGTEADHGQNLDALGLGALGGHLAGRR